MSLNTLASVHIRYKWIALVQFVILLVLLGVWINHEIVERSMEKQRAEGLLSPRIYTGLLEPESRLIVNFQPLKQDLQGYLTKHNLTAGIYVENLRNGASMGINEKMGFYPASLAKLPLAVAIMKKVERGELTLDTPVQLQNRDDYDAFGRHSTLPATLSVDELLTKLLTDSNNLAAQELFLLLEPDDFQLLIDYYGIDINLQSEGSTYRMTPKSISILFISLYFSTVLETESSEHLLHLMENTVLDIRPFAQIPDDVRVVHKFGVNDEGGSLQDFHDCGIMYIEDSRFFYCVMTQDTQNQNQEQLLAHTTNIMGQIYQYIVKTRVDLKKLE